METRNLSSFSGAMHLNPCARIDHSRTPRVRAGGALGHPHCPPWSGCPSLWMWGLPGWTSGQAPDNATSVEGQHEAVSFSHLPLSAREGCFPPLSGQVVPVLGAFCQPGKVGSGGRARARWASQWTLGLALSSGRPALTAHAGSRGACGRLLACRKVPGGLPMLPHCPGSGDLNTWHRKDRRRSPAPGA